MPLGLFFSSRVSAWKHVFLTPNSWISTNFEKLGGSDWLVMWCVNISYLQTGLARFSHDYCSYRAISPAHQMSKTCVSKLLPNGNILWLFFSGFVPANCIRGEVPCFFWSPPASRSLRPLWPLGHRAHQDEQNEGKTWVRATQAGLEWVQHGPAFIFYLAMFKR